MRKIRDDLHEANEKEAIHYRGGEGDHFYSVTHLDRINLSNDL